MDPLFLIKKYYDEESRSYKLLVEHSVLVAEKALSIAQGVPHLNPDIQFIAEAAMLHDIGMYRTYFPQLDCFGDDPYICHGHHGRELLEKEGLPRHALVCERHTGSGLSLSEIIERDLPLPKRNMNPVSVEEEIICLADTFFSKTNTPLSREKTIHEVRNSLKKYGDLQVKKFDMLCKKYL